jgi:hypothetical protein
MLTGQTSDFSSILQFHFWEDICYTRVDSTFPSESNEDLGNFVGIADSAVGDAMTFIVLSRDTNKEEEDGQIHLLRLSRLLQIILRIWISIQPKFDSWLKQEMSTRSDSNL